MLPSRLFQLVPYDGGFMLTATVPDMPYSVRISDSPIMPSFITDPCIFRGRFFFRTSFNSRPFCHIQWDDGATIVSVQDLAAGNCYNLRDLGGYLNEDGTATVRYGLIFRCDQPLSMGAEAETVFRKLGIRSVLDFRGSVEHSMMPDPEIDGVENLWLPVFEENPAAPRKHMELSDIFAKDDDWKAEQISELHASYRAMPFAADAYRPLFQILSDGNVPILFHCLAGKDRTGIGAMLVLLALGIPFETILEDYLHCSDAFQAYIDYRHGNFEEYLNSDLSLDHFIGFFFVKEENLRTSMQAILDKYGTVERFFLECYDLDSSALKHLRSRYLLPIRS